MTKNESDKTDENYDKFNDSCAKYYSPTEHPAVDEITAFFKVRVIFKQYISKKTQAVWDIKLHKMCDSKGYTYNMTVYLKNDRNCATPSMTATHATATGLAAKD